MAIEISSFVLHFLVKEFEVLKSGKVEKIYQLDDSFIFKIHTSSGKKFLRFSLPGIVSLSSQEFKAPMNPPGFCMFLRKYLSGARVVDVFQKDFERILVIKFSSKLGVFLFIAELFKPGNLILCSQAEDSSLVVVNALERQKFKDRVIWAKKPYAFPPPLINPLLVSEEDLLGLVNSSDRNLVKSFASRFGLGGLYAEEIIKLSGVDKNLEVISSNDAVLLKKAILDFFNQSFVPTLVKGSLILQVGGGEGVKSISEVIDVNSPLQVGVSKASVSSSKKDKTSSLVEIQEKMIRNLEKSADENQAKGEFIYSHYQEFLKLLNDANKIRHEEGLVALEGVLKNNKKFVSLNKKDKIISLKF